MLFPEHDRVAYEKNPLAQVICQLTFPTILKISNEAPAGFQEAIRHDYPLYAKRGDQIIPREFANLVPDDFLNAVSNTAHVFESDDNLWSVTLKQDSLALATKKYTRWEHFRSRIDGLARALTTSY